MAFNLKGILSLDNKGFLSGIQEASNQSSKLNNITQSVTGGIKKMVMAGAGIAGIGLGVSDVITTFKDFQKEMSNVQAITGETDKKQLKALTEKAKEMGRILPASASDAAEAMANLGSAGFSTDEIMKSVEGTLYLATSAQTDMATASDIASSTLRGFGLEASQAGHVADVLSKVAADTNAGIIDTGESMKYAAPVAKALGISMEETSAAIGLMANAGIKGSQSGTTLRGALTRLVKPSKESRLAMEKMGFTAIDTNGNMKNLTTIIAELSQGTKNYTSAEKNAALAQIFGQEALSGMLALMDAGPSSINKLTRSLEQADGASKAMAETQTNNLYGALEEIDGAFETLKINIGEQAAPAITAALKSFADVIPVIGDGVVDMVNKFMEFASIAYNAIQPALSQVKDFIITEVVPRFSELGTTIGELAETYMPLIGGAFDSFKETAGLVVTEGLDLVNSALQFFNDHSVLVVGALTILGVAMGIYRGACIATSIAQGIQNASFGFGIIQSALLSAGIVALYVKDYALAAAHGIATAAQWALNLAMGAGLIPVMLVVGGLAALVAGVVIAYKKLSWFRDLVNVVWDALKGFAKVVGSVFKSVGELAGKIGKFVGIGGEKNANGTGYFQGGTTQINERGPEMQILPSGVGIIPAERTEKMLNNQDLNSGNNSNINIQIDARGMNPKELATELKLMLGNQ